MSDKQRESAGYRAAVHVVLGLTEDEYDAMLLLDRRTNGGGVSVFYEPRWHSHPALGITGHAHGPTIEVARQPHSHRPEVGWDHTPIPLEPEADVVMVPKDLLASVVWEFNELMSLVYEFTETSTMPVDEATETHQRAMPTLRAIADTLTAQSDSTTSVTAAAS